LRCSRTSRSTCDLRHCVESVGGDEVDQQADLDAVALHERDRLEQRPPSRVLAREGLHEPAEVREQRREQRPRHQLRDPPPADGLAVERSTVVALHVADGGVHEHRGHEPGDEVRAEVPHVGVEPADDVAFARVERQPERVPLAGARRYVGEDRVDGEHDRAFGPRDLGGGVGRPVVHHHHFVDESRFLDEVLAHRCDDWSDRRLLVAGGETHRDHGARLGTHERT
jgi:hypothetical protein